MKVKRWVVPDVIPLVGSGEAAPLKASGKLLVLFFWL
jgi:hypothetical protein